MEKTDLLLSKLTYETIEFKRWMQKSRDSIKKPINSDYIHIGIDDLFYKQEEVYGEFIEEIVHANELGLLFGVNGINNTNVALDIALSVATMKKWAGLDVYKHKVLYIDCVNPSNTKYRIKNWINNHNISIESLIENFSYARINLSTKDINILYFEIENYIKEKGNPGLIIIDSPWRYEEEGIYKQNKIDCNFNTILRCISNNFNVSVFVILKTKTPHWKEELDWDLEDYNYSMDKVYRIFESENKGINFVRVKSRSSACDFSLKFKIKDGILCQITD